jgi:phosphoglycerate dehydrogenase-like enzyme
LKSVKVLFIWQPKNELKEYLLNGLSDTAGIELIFPDSTDEKTLKFLAVDVDIIIGWKPTKEILESAGNLSMYISPGAGAQHLIELFRDINKTRNVILVNGHGNAYFTAQHTVALLLALLNKIIPHHNWMENGVWRQGDKQAASIPLRERKIGLLGFGAINRYVHKFLSPYDNEFHVLKREWDEENNPTGITKYSPKEFDQFLKVINTLIIAVPLTSKTIGLISAKQLELLGKDGLLVNVGRGPIIDEKSLFNALKEKVISGAAIDVWYDYRPEPDTNGKKYPYKYPFHKLSNIVLSPHRAASPFDDLKRWDEVIENIKRFTVGSRDIINKVDLDNEY